MDYDEIIIRVKREDDPDEEKPWFYLNFNGQEECFGHIGALKRRAAQLVVNRLTLSFGRSIEEYAALRGN